MDGSLNIPSSKTNWQTMHDPMPIWPCLTCMASEQEVATGLTLPIGTNWQREWQTHTFPEGEYGLNLALVFWSVQRGGCHLTVFHPLTTVPELFITSDTSDYSCLKLPCHCIVFSVVYWESWLLQME